jgi:hypothetical protein
MNAKCRVRSHLQRCGRYNQGVVLGKTVITSKRIATGSQKLDGSMSTVKNERVSPAINTYMTRLARFPHYCRSRKRRK